MSYLKVGFITKPHGLKGELSVLPLTDNTDRYKKLKTIFLLINDQFVEEELEYSHKKINNIIIKLKKYDKIDDVERFRSVYIYIDRASGEPLGNNEYYTQDLTGCRLRYKEQIVGVIESVQNLGSCDLLSVRHGEKEIFYPMLMKYIDNVDIENGIIDINQFEGFFD